MLGKRSLQRGIFEADQQYLDFVGQDTFYGFLARHGYELFQDEAFAELYCEDNGRPSVPPSLQAIALLLQAHDGVSDEEAKRRADYDMCWKVALGVELDDLPFAKSTLQLFRSQLILHEKAQAIFLRSLEHAKEQGYLTGARGSLALDTTPILGRGAVKDTYNLLADGIKKLIWGLAKRLEGIRPEKWAQKHDFGRYFGSSIEGEADIDWGDERARRVFLASIVADADRLLAIAQERLIAVPQGSEEERQIRPAEDAFPGPDGRDRGQSDPCCEQNRANGRFFRRASDPFASSGPSSAASGTDRRPEQPNPARLHPEGACTSTTPEPWFSAGLLAPSPELVDLRHQTWIVHRRRSRRRQAPSPTSPVGQLRRPGGVGRHTLLRPLRMPRIGQLSPMSS